MRSTILFVDDEPDLAATCARLLKRGGWRVETAGTRAAGIEATAHQPALAIVDRQLPDGDGVDVLRAALSAGTPVIMISAHDWPGTRRLALDEAAAAFLGKPFSTGELLELVRAILGEPRNGAACASLSPPGRPG